MKLRAVHRRSGFSVTLVLLALGTITSAGHGWAQDRIKQVLVVYSTRPDTQLPTVGDRELPRVLRDGLAGRLDYYAEYIDVPRFPGVDYEPAFHDFLSRKYSGKRFDLVIAAQDVAFQFVEKYRDELFPDTPLVFSATDRNARRLTNATGIIVRLDLTRTLELAAALQPDVKQVFVVTGASDRDKVYESLARTQFEPLGQRFTFAYLSGLRITELEQRVATLPSRSIVYYLLFYEDGDGVHFQPLDYLNRFTAIANRPTYAWVDSTIGRGVIGGSLQAQAAVIDALASSSLRILRGEPADSIPMVTPDLNVAQVDWRQLRRWGISEARIPAGTRILFREPGLWDRYKIYIVGALTLLLAQAALIVGLFVQQTKRRKAELRVRDLGGRLLTAQESERARIARELHDDISQQLALLMMDLERLGGLEETRRGDVRRDAHKVTERAEGIIESVRDLSHRLHPSKLRLIGLTEALGQLQGELSHPGIELTFTHADIPSALPEEITFCLYRTAQEALHNALKHSGARHVSIRLGGDGKRIVLSVTDDGKGFDVDAAQHRGLGLISMRERIEYLGGTLTIQSARSGGTRLEAAVPLR